jgi:hypothetical protein
MGNAVFLNSYESGDEDIADFIEINKVSMQHWNDLKSKKTQLLSSSIKSRI